MGKFDCKIGFDAGLVFDPELLRLVRNARVSFAHQRCKARQQFATLTSDFFSNAHQFFCKALQRIFVNQVLFE